MAKFTGREHDAREIGRRLGVEAVLDGTVQRAGERVRVTATLIDLRDDRMLWSGKFDEQFTDIFALQDTLSEKVSAALEMHFSQARAWPPDKRYKPNAEAYELYLMGIYFWNKRTPHGLSKAAEYLRRAVEKDPNYALEVDPAFWRARLNLGGAYEDKGMYAEAEAEYRKVAEQEGVRLQGEQELAYLYATTGRQAEARELLRRILERARTGANMESAGVGVALIRVALGEKDAAFRWLNRAADARGVAYYSLKYNSDLDPLRTDPRFAALQERVRSDR